MRSATYPRRPTWQKMTILRSFGSSNARARSLGSGTFTAPLSVPWATSAGSRTSSSSAPSGSASAYAGVVTPSSAFVAIMPATLIGSLAELNGGA